MSSGVATVPTYSFTACRGTECISRPVGPKTAAAWHCAAVQLEVDHGRATAIDVLPHFAVQPAALHRAAARFMQCQDTPWVRLTRTVVQDDFSIQIGRDGSVTLEQKRAWSQGCDPDLVITTATRFDLLHTQPGAVPSWLCDMGVTGLSVVSNDLDYVARQQMLWSSHSALLLLQRLLAQRDADEVSGQVTVAGGQIESRVKRTKDASGELALTFIGNETIYGMEIAAWRRCSAVLAAVLDVPSWPVDFAKCQADSDQKYALLRLVTMGRSRDWSVTAPSRSGLPLLPAAHSAP